MSTAHICRLVKTLIGITKPPRRALLHSYRLLNKALQAPSFRGDSVILIVVPYCILVKQEEKEQTIVVLVNKNLLAT